MRNPDADDLVSRPTIRKIEIREVPDDCPDLSYLGNFTDEYTEGAIDLHEERITTTSWSPRYFVPAYSEAERIKDMREDGTGRPMKTIRNLAHLACIDDARRVLSHGDGWYMMGVTAEAEVTYETEAGHLRITKFDSGGIWSVESDSDQGHLDEIRNEELDDLKRHLKRFNVDTSNFNRLAREKVEGYRP